MAPKRDGPLEPSVMILNSLAALGIGHFLPGLLVVKLLDVGRSRGERFLAAAVLGGPLAALLHLAVLSSGAGAWYWVGALALALAALVVPFRRRPAPPWPRASVVTLAAVLAAVLLPYALTTGSLYRLDADGGYVMDRALQRDALFHVGLVRSLETSYPPRLLSVSGARIGYHVGYHLQLALWARFYGIDPFDGVVRLGAAWFLALYVLTAYALARRLFEGETTRLLSAVLVLASGFGYAVFFRPAVDWWSLAFMDWALVSIFLANPLLPALPLLFLGLAFLHDFWETGARGSLAASLFSLSSLLFVKMFLGAQVLAALGIATLLRRRDRRAWALSATLGLASTPVLIHTLFAAAGSNTSVGLRPLEIVRYSMEKLGWERAIAALADVGSFRAPEAGFPVALAATLLWIVGFLGVRALGLAGMTRDLRADGLLRRTLAWFAVLGFPLALFLRIAPAEAEGLSRLEALNDVGWFATSSGIVLWFWTASSASRFHPAVVLALSLPATVQHFVHALSLETDRVGPSRVEAVERAAALSAPGSVWVSPPDRARPSLLPYLAGRAVVYDPYVGYDYMFVGRDEIDYRRHAVAQFWSSSDPAFAAWFLDRFGVEFVWQEGRDRPRAPLEPLFSNDDVTLYRVERDALRGRLTMRIASPESLPLGGAGEPYFGSGWHREGRRRLLSPGGAKLYLPAEEGRALRISLEFASPHEVGELVVEGLASRLSAGEGRLLLELPPRRSRGLHAVEIDWRGEAPLRVTAIEVSAPAP